jgi:translocation and assembly module TamB
MKRAIARWLRRLVVSVAAVIALGIVLLLLLQTPPAKRAVADRLASTLTTASGFQVQIGGLEGTLPFEAEITNVRVSDADGPWLTVDRLTLGWRPLDLLAGRLHVTGLAAETVTLVHRPASPPEQPTDTRGIDLSLGLPQLPLPTTVDGFRIERIVFAPAVFGEAAMLNLSGRARLGGAAREAAITLAIARVDGRAGAAGLTFEQSGSPARLTLDASIDEPADGLIARALSLPGLPPVSLRLAGSGAASDWRGRLRAVAGSTRLDGAVALAIDDALSLDLGAHADEAGRLTPGMAAFVPQSFDIAVRLRWQPGQRLDVARLAIAAPEATVGLSGDLDLDTGRVQASFDAAIADAARWQPLLAPASLRTARLAGSVSGPLDRPSFALQTSIDELAVPQIGSGRLEAKVAGSATLRDRQVVTALSIAAEGTAGGIAIADPRLAAIIGDTAAWSIAGTVDLARGGATIEQAKIAVEDATIAAAGSIDAHGRAVNATLQVALNDIGPLAQALDQPAAGRLDLTASLSGDAVAPRLSAVVSGSFRDLALAEPTLMKLLGTAPAIKGALVATDTTVEIRALEIAGPGGTLTADGTVGVDGASLDLDLAAAVPEIAPLTASLVGAVGGRLAGKLHITRARPDPQLHFAGTADLTSLHAPEPAAALLGHSVHASAEGALDGGRVMLRSVQIEGAATRVTAGGTIGDTLDLQYRLELPRLAALAPFTRIDLAGSSTITGDLAGPMKSPALAGAISADALRVGGVPVESVDGNISVVDLVARPQGRLGLDLVARAQRLSLATEYRWMEDGAVALTDLRLAAPQTLLTGDIAVLPAGLLLGRIRGDFGDLTVLKSFVAQPVAGMATVDVTLTPADEAQSIDAAVEVQNFSFSPAGEAPVSAARLTLSAGVGDAFGAPGGHVDLRVDDARTGDIMLTNASLVADGGAKNLQLQLQATGEWGRPIAIDGAGNLMFDNAEQRLRVDRLESSLGTLQARLNRPATLRRDSGGIALADLDAMIGTGRLTGEGRIGGEQVDLRLALADAPLDVIGAFVSQADLGGIASAELRLFGSTAAPSAHADIRVRDLRVGATRIGAALGVDSTATVDIGAGRSDITAQLGGPSELALAGRLSIPMSFALQPLSFTLADDAPVSGQLSGQADLALLPRVIDLRGDQLGGRLGIDMTIGGTVAKPRLRGELQVSDGNYVNARTGMVLRDVTAVLTSDKDRLVLRSLTASDGGEGRLSAIGSAALGSPDKARYEADLTLRQFGLRKGGNGTTASGHLAGQLELTPAVDGMRRFAATADADELVVNGRSVAFLGPHMRATAEGSMGAAGMAIESAQVAGTDGRLSASGTIGDDLDLAYRLELLRLAALSPLVGRDLAGSATVAGMVTGPWASPTIDGAFSGRALRFAALAVESADGTFNARDLASRPRGEMALDLVAKARQLSLATNYRLKEDGAVALDGLKLTAPKTAVGGDVEILASGLLNGRIRGEVGDLASIAAFLDRNCAGAAMLDLSFAPARRGQAIDGSIDLRSLSFVMDDGTPLSAQRVSLSAQVGDAFGKPAGTAELRVAEAAVGELSLTQAILNGAGNAEALKIRLQAKGTQGHPFDLAADGILAVAEAEQRLRLDHLEGSYGPLEARLNAPASLARDSRGIALAGLDAAIGDGRLTGGGRIGPKQVDLRLSVRELPIEALAALTQQADVAGKITADLRLAGTPAVPSAHAEMRIADLSVGDTKITEVAGIEGTARLDLQGGRGTLSARLGGSPDVAIDGQATAPVAFRLQPFVLDLAPDAPVSGKVSGRVNLALLPRVVDLHGDTLAGRLDMDMALAGTPAAPRLAGEAHLADGSYASAEAGAVLRDVTAVIAADGGRVRLQSLTASDGGKGRLSASGAATLRGAERALYEGELTLEHFTVLNRSDAVAVASGRLQLANEAQGARLGGEVTVESAELRVPEAMPPKIVKLDVVEVNVPPERIRPVRRKEERVALPVALGVTVEIPGHAFLRGRGIDSEWRGKLLVGGTMAAPDIKGRLEVVRGRVDLLGQPFEIETGRVAFAGGDTIDPQLDFTARGEAADLTVLVHVTGVASAPKFELGTDSNLPPEEALARLLFGKNAGSLSAAQAVQLAQAAAALSGGGPGVLDKLRRTFGLDVLRVETTTGSETGASVTAGKYVSERVFLKIQQGTTSDSRNVGVEVRVLPRVTVEGSVGAQGDNKVGVNWRYDY